MWRQRVTAKIARKHDVIREGRGGETDQDNSKFMASEDMKTTGTVLRSLPPDCPPPISVETLACRLAANPALMELFQT